MELYARVRRAAMVEGESQRAPELFQRVLALNPDHGGAHLEFGLWHSRWPLPVAGHDSWGLRRGQHGTFHRHQRHRHSGPNRATISVRLWAFINRGATHHVNDQFYSEAPYRRSYLPPASCFATTDPRSASGHNRSPRPSLSEVRPISTFACQLCTALARTPVR